jgi:hypothetical protein
MSLALPLYWYFMPPAPSAGPAPPHAPAPLIPEQDPAAGQPSTDAMEQLARTDPLKFLEHVLRRLRADLKDYRMVLQKQERTGGKLHDKEVIDVFFRDTPHSVCLIWKEGARRAERALFVEGENDGKMLVRPKGLLRVGGSIVTRDVDGEDARMSGRVQLNQYGIKKAVERFYTAWKAAKDSGTLKVEYLGIERISAADNKPCFRLRRTCATPEQDGVLEQTLLIDTENWHLVGSIIRGKDGQLIGEYYCRDIRLNPEFSAGQFTKDALVPR